MQIHGSFAKVELGASILRWGSKTGRRTLLAATILLASACGTGFAQFLENYAFLPGPVRTVSTVPPNGDLNPYGVAFVPRFFMSGAGPLRAGDVLVSNFNNSMNLQGTGSTIIRVPAGGSPSVFYQGPTTGEGLSTALGILRPGLVIVGNAPTTDGTAATAAPGALLVINNQGALIQTIANAWIQFPWDMALVDNGSHAIAFVTNALNGTVSRFNFQVASSGLTMLSAKTIASGYIHQADPVAVFDAPTGLVYDPQHDVLYVASTGDNAVFAVPNAASTQTDNGTGTVIYQDNVHLHGALGLVAAPNGHLLVSNNDTINPDPNQPSEIVEFTTQGVFVKQLSVDPNPGGSFGMAVMTTNAQSMFAAVDDNASTLTIWTLNP